MSIKVYIHIEIDGFPEKTSKLTVPKGWVSSKVVSDVIGLFLESYNAKNPEHALEVANVHLETAASSGVKIYSDSKIDAALEDRVDYFIIQGSHKLPETVFDTSAATVKAGSLRCRNYGCNAYFTEEENGDESCRHHTLPPFFHDTAKGWQCCREKKAYDWDDFQAIKGCSVGRHSTVEQKQVFQESPTVSAANSASSSSSSSASSSSTDLDSSSASAGITVAPPLRSIAEYNISNPTAATAASSARTALERKSTRNPDGITARCLNKGCQKVFNLSENDANACIHHEGQPVFHDALKFWSCCSHKKCCEFDAFLAVPGCVLGYHDDGVIDEATLAEKKPR